MTRRTVTDSAASRSRLLLLGAALSMVSVAGFAACGSDDGTKSANPASGGAGGTPGESGAPNAGGSTSSAAGETSQGAAPSLGTGGALGAAGAGDAAGDASAGGSTTTAGGAPGEAGMNGGVGASDGGTAGAGGADATGCRAPRAETPLSAATEGLPTTGLVVWLRGDRGVHKSADQRVCAWADQSGSGYLFTSGGAEPLWVATSVGAQPAIHYDAVGTDLTVYNALGLSATSARTFIAVTQLVSTMGRFHGIIQGVASSPGTYLSLDANTWFTAGSHEGVYITGNSYDSQTAANTSPHVQIYTLGTLTSGATVASTVDYRIDGVTQTLTLKSGGGTVGDFIDANFTTVGSVDPTSTVHPAVGDAFVAEALVYDRALTVDERGAVEIALKARYAIP